MPPPRGKENKAGVVLLRLVAELRFLLRKWARQCLEEAEGQAGPSAATFGEVYLVMNDFYRLISGLV